MATLDTTVDYNAKLQLRYHSSKPPSALAQKKIAHAVDLARVILAKVLLQIQGHGTNPATISGVGKQTYQTHFKFSEFKNLPAVITNWKGNIATIKQVYLLTNVGLS